MSKGKTILFFDLTLVGILRYPRSIMHEVSRKRRDIRGVFVYDEELGLSPKEALLKLPTGSTLMKVKTPSLRCIQEIFDLAKPDALVVMALRIPDIAFLSVAKSQGVRTVLVQHGLLVPFMKREPLMFLQKLRKTARYVRYANVVSQATGRSFSSLLRDMIEVFVRGKGFSESALSAAEMSADEVLVYGKYWVEYFHRVYGYPAEKQHIVGYPDLHEKKKVFSQPLERAACYVAQTLVEDGRLAKELFLDFVEKLSRSTEGTKLYVKLHPRSDMGLFEALSARGNVMFVREGLLPHCTKYIGHYSSLLILAAHLSRNIFLWELPGHEIPEYLREIALVRSESEDDLSAFVAGDDSRHEVGEGQIQQINESFYYDGKNPVEKIADFLLEGAW